MRSGTSISPTLLVIVVALAVAAAVALALPTAGSGATTVYDNSACTCHNDRVQAVAASAHKDKPCEMCHANALVHLADATKQIKPSVRFDLELCGDAGCHPDQYGTYTYGDSFKTKYGGSPNAWPKTNDFSHYNDIIDGHGFVREYNEERSHNVMLKDHFDIKRGKFDVCLQCKSTKVAYYWDSGKERTIQTALDVKAGHMAATITIPAGTKVKMATDRTTAKPYTHEVAVLVTLPDGSTYTTSKHAYPSATDSATVTWAALYALTVDGVSPETVDSGNGCNHCHDPHRAARDAQGELIGFRLIRKSEIWQIARKGVNPYNPSSPRTFDSNLPLDMERGVALCAQCHVEYVCGKAGIDGINRDYFPWAKVGELEGIYKAEFPPWTPSSGIPYPGPYVMDWSHGATTSALASLRAPGYYNTPFPIFEPLIKSQHPEAETYWGSRHYANGAPCFLCHMPKVTKIADGKTFTSHWLASPEKYMSSGSVGPFASAFGLMLDKDGVIVPCGSCHGGYLARMRQKAVNIQDGNYSMALTVETRLMDALKAIKAAKDAKAAGRNVDMNKLKLATDNYRAAHVRWENLAVSENSMGFHDPAAFNTEMNNATKYATNAKNYATGALPRK